MFPIYLEDQIFQGSLREQQFGLESGDRERHKEVVKGTEGEGERVAWNISVVKK
jgi:hypothetical protein